MPLFRVLKKKTSSHVSEEIEAKTETHRGFRLDPQPIKRALKRAKRYPLRYPRRSAGDVTQGNSRSLGLDAPAFLAPLLFSLVIFSIFETGLTNQFFPEARPDTYIKPFSAFQVLATKRTGFWVVIISIPLVSQRHLLGFLR